jgi:hypothetical protein
MHACMPMHLQPHGMQNHRPQHTPSPAAHAKMAHLRPRTVQVMDAKVHCIGWVQRWQEHDPDAAGRWTLPFASACLACGISLTVTSSMTQSCYAQSIAGPRLGRGLQCMGLGTLQLVHIMREGCIASIAKGGLVCECVLAALRMADRPW